MYILICCALCVAVPNTLHLFPLLYSISPLCSFLTLVEDFGKQLLYLIYVLFMKLELFLFVACHLFNIVYLED